MSFRNIFTALEMVLLMLFLVPFPVINVGNATGIVISVSMLLISCSWEEFLSLLSSIGQSVAGIIVLTVLFMLMSAAAAYAFIISVKMFTAMRKYPDKPDILIVPGCKVIGKRPSRMLRRRLETALKYMNDNPDVLCIVSGGKGSDEMITEAEAMKEYLVSKGIDGSRIFKEDNSSSTDENMKFSLEIIERLEMERSVTIVTDGFHQYRSAVTARKYGARKVHALSARTEPRYIFTYWIREWFGILKIIVHK